VNTNRKLTTISSKLVLYSIERQAKVDRISLMKLVESLSCHVHDHVSFAAGSMIYRTLWADKQ